MTSILRRKVASHFDIILDATTGPAPSFHKEAHSVSSNLI